LDATCVPEEPVGSSCCPTKVRWEIIAPLPFGEDDHQSSPSLGDETIESNNLQITQCPQSEDEAAALVADWTASRAASAKEERDTAQKSNTRGFTSAALSILSAMTHRPHHHHAMATTADLLVGAIDEALDCSNVQCIDQCNSPENQCQYLLDQDYECVSVGRTQSECCAGGVEWFKDGQQTFSSCPRNGGLRG
jgi:hypothetical protein